MTQKLIALIGFLVGSALTVQSAQACMEHYFYEQGGSGSFLNRSSSFSGFKRPAPKPKHFTINHAPTTVAIIDKAQELEIKYDVPESAKNVRIELKATNNVELLDEKLVVADAKGATNARFKANQRGLGTISVTVNGEYNGEELSYTSTIYVSIKSA